MLQIHDYLINTNRLLGRGGFGSVYEASKGNKKYACKVVFLIIFTKALKCQEINFKYISTEIGAMGFLRHPNIV